MLLSATLHVTAAGAKERLLTTGAIDHGPIASGADVVWGRWDRDGFGVYRDVPGGRDQRIGSLPGLDLPEPTVMGGTYPNNEAELVARDGRIAVMRHGRYRNRYGPLLTSHKARLDTRGPDGAWRSLWSCDDDLRSPLTAVSAEAVAHTPAACGEHPNRIGVFDELGSGSPRQTILAPPLGPVVNPYNPPYVESLAVAGRFVAYNGFSPQQAGVMDRLTGEVVYRLPEGTSFHALQADGKVATCHQGRLAWFSPAEPSAHFVPGVSGCHQIIALEDDVVAWRNDSGAGSALQQVTFAGRVRTLASFRRTLHVAGHPTYDDGRFAFRRDGCVVTANLASEKENGPRDNGTCPVRVLSARLTRGGLAIRLRCPDGCRGSLEPRVPVLSRGPSYGRAPALRKDFLLMPGTSRTITYRDRRLRRHLRDTRTLRLRVRHLSRRAGKTLQHIRRIPLRR